MAINIIDKNLSFNSNHTDRVGSPRGIIVHHAAIKTATVEQIHQSHKANGYAGIGYHFYVRKDGTIYRGRPEKWRGGHATNHNDYIGVCAEGNFENETMTPVQKNAIAEVLRYLLDKYGNLTIVRHRDVNATACPGKHYPFSEIVALTKKTASTPTASGKVNALVKAFQQACVADGVSVGKAGADGIWGPDTEAAAKKNLRKGSKGERVRALQKRLRDLGYDLGTTGASKNGIDGDFGTKTDKAVRAFQKKNTLAEDGIVGVKTWKVLLGV